MKTMKLKYRGISYKASNPFHSGSPDTVEGRYHGLRTEISLPLLQDSIEDSVSLMTYRGVQLATR